MSGRFNAAAGPAPEVRPTTRLALVNEEHNLVAHLSAMTVKHGGVGERATASIQHTWMVADIVMTHCLLRVSAVCKCTIAWDLLCT
jgi:hypothetical protein